MQKLKLNLGDLEVQAFATASPGANANGAWRAATPTCGVVSCDAACWTQDRIHNPYC
jgi:hypothetical protein